MKRGTYLPLPLLWHVVPACVLRPVKLRLGQYLLDALLDSKIFLPTLCFDFLEGFLSVAEHRHEGDGDGRARELQGRGRVDSVPYWTAPLGAQQLQDLHVELYAIQKGQQRFPEERGVIRLTSLPTFPPSPRRPALGGHPQASKL